MDFKQLDIDYDKVTLDGSVLQKPKYMGIQQWLDFWEQFDGQSVDEKVKAAWYEGFEQAGKERDGELEDIQNHVTKEINHFSKNLQAWVNDTTVSKDELTDYIITETDRITESVWRL